MSNFKKYIRLIQEVAETSKQPDQESKSTNTPYKPPMEDKRMNQVTTDKGFISKDTKVGINLSLSNNKINLRSIFQSFKNIKDMKGINLNMLDDIVQFIPFQSQKEGLVWFTNMTFGLNTPSKFLLPVAFYSKYSPNQLVPIKKIFFVFKPLDASMTKFEFVEAKDNQNEILDDKNYNFIGDIGTKVKNNIDDTIKTPKDYVRIKVEEDEQKNKKIIIESNKPF